MKKKTNTEQPLTIFTDENKTVTLGFLNEKKYRNMHQEVLSKEVEIKRTV
jgi:hypothetical protein